MKVDRIGHLVLMVNDIDAICKFYTEVLGMEMEAYSMRRRTLKFGNQKLDIRQKGREFSQGTENLAPGTIDICFVVADPIEDIKKELESRNIPIQGIAERTGATGKVFSIYFHDPDYNMIEVSNYK
jgi:catechol 2,3-dioxygenase-like lactoylglutathione lyase family enzyme